MEDILYLQFIIILVPSLFFVFLCFSSCFPPSICVQDDVPRVCANSKSSSEVSVVVIHVTASNTSQPVVLVGELIA